MTIDATLWDSAELLDMPEEIAAYIEAAVENGDAALLTHALGVVARAKGMSRIAAEAGSREKSCTRRSPRMAIREFRPCSVF